MKQRTQLATLAACATLSAAACGAEALPQDLHTLSAKWAELQQKPNMEPLLRLDIFETADPQPLHGKVIRQMEEERVQASNNILNYVQFEERHDKVRATLVTKLFPTLESYPKFCDSIQTDPVQPKKAKALSEAELERAEAIQRRTSCQAKVKNSLQDILYGNPRTFFYEVQGDQGAEVVAYVQSMITEGIYLRYQFQLR